MRDAIAMLRSLAPTVAAAAIFCLAPRPALVVDRSAAVIAADAPALDPIQAADLRDGDVAMIAANTVAAAFVLSLSGDDARYSHCGLIVRTEGRWVLVHSAPANEAAGDRGYTEAVPLDEFRRRSSVRLLDVYRHVDPAAAARAALAARSFAASAVPFDGSFDLASDDRLYCSELVWKCYLAAGSTDPLHGRLDLGRSAFAPARMILPNSLAISDQFRPVGVLVIDPLLVRHP